MSGVNYPVMVNGKNQEIGKKTYSFKPRVKAI
jgi:hypothetical protein